jgi:hypothetical protein
MRKESSRAARRVGMVVIIITVAALVYALSHAFTWEGELDPNAFDNWEFVGSLSAGPGVAWLILKNPDPAHAIKTVAALVDLNDNVLGYRYFKHGMPYSYFFDMGQEKYILHHYTVKQKKQCMQCHQDQLQPEDARIRL